MADVEILGALQEAAGGDPAPSAPQLPFGADPGSFTGWLLESTAEDPSSVVMTQIRSATALFQALPATTDATYETKMHAIANSIPNSEGMNAFLGVTTNGLHEVRVSVVHGLATYNSGLGRASQFDNGTYAFWGEVVDDQLPPVLRLPTGDAQALYDLFNPEPCKIPNAQVVTTHFDAAAGTVPYPLLPVPSDANSTVGSFSKLQHLPDAWVPYFLGDMTPLQALDMAEKLVTTLETADERDEAGIIVQWCRAALVRNGNHANTRRKSQLNVAWLWPSVTQDRGFSRWRRRRLEPFRMPQPSSNHPQLPTAALIEALSNRGTNASTKEAKAYSALEHQIIRLAAGLSEADYQMRAPPIYSELITEGRTTTSVQRVLEARTAPGEHDFDPIPIYISSEMAKDVKDLAFGYGGDLSYETCHRGLSPFAVIAVSMEQQSKRKRQQELARRATTVSVSDIQALETEPGQCPHGYSGLMEVLRRYASLLVILVGQYATHYIEIRQVIQTLRRMTAVYESMPPQDVAQILWAIFIDARRYFNHKGPSLPTSSLSVMTVWLQTCSINQTVNCPTARLLGFNHTPQARLPPYAPTPTQISGSVISDLSSIPPTGFPPGSVPFPNDAPVPELISAMRPFHTDFPSVDMSSLMSHTNTSYGSVSIGTPGTCLDHVYFGECRNAACSYKHSPVRATPSRVGKVITALKTATDKYRASPG